MEQRDFLKTTGLAAGLVCLKSSTNCSGTSENQLVTIRVRRRPDAWRAAANLAVLRRGRAELRLHERRKETPHGTRRPSTEIGLLSPHNLLTSGDGTPALKWGSTGAYSEDPQSNPVYNWTIVDRIFDTYLERGVRPYAQIGFMPRELSVKPDPYQHKWRPGEIRRHLHRLGLPSQGLQEVGRAGLPVDETLRREVRSRRGRIVVLAGME